MFGERMEVSSTMITTILTFSALWAVFASRVSASSIDDGVRLSGGGTYGRVEVHSMGTWLPICDDDWTMIDATVVCRQLELGIFGLPVTDETFHDGEKRPIRVTKKCSGYEERLQDCSTEHRRSDCGESPVAGVLCNPRMRLDGSSNMNSDSHEGYLRLLQPYQHKWIRVKDHSLLDPKIATEVCLELGLGFTGLISYTRNDDFDISSGDDETDIIHNKTNHPVISCSSDKPETSTIQNNRRTNQHNPIVTSILIVVIICIIIIAVVFLFCRVYTKVFLFRRLEEEKSPTALTQPSMPLSPVKEEPRYADNPNSKVPNQAKGIEEKGQTTSDSVIECPDEKSNALNNGGIS